MALASSDASATFFSAIITGSTLFRRPSRRPSGGFSESWWGRGCRWAGVRAWVGYRRQQHIWRGRLASGDATLRISGSKGSARWPTR